MLTRQPLGDDEWAASRPVHRLTHRTGGKRAISGRAHGRMQIPVAKETGHAQWSRSSDVQGQNCYNITGPIQAGETVQLSTWSKTSPPIGVPIPCGERVFGRLRQPSPLFADIL